jgi:anti-repressor protein
MEQLEQVFSYKQKEVRVYLINDQPYFLAKDVCEILEHSDTRKAVSRLDEDEKLIGTIFLSGQNREVWFINEAGLYSLILTSRKPEAKTFKRWVTHEVLPSIRQTGSYSVHNHRLPMTYKEALLALITEIEEKEKLQQLVSEQSPKVEAYDTFMNAEGCQNMNQVAKTLNWGRNKLFRFLRQKKILIDSDSPYQKNLPYQQYIDAGYFKVIEVPIRNGTNIKVGTQTLVTTKGVDFIAKLIKRHEVRTAMIKGYKQMQKEGFVYEN